MDIQRNDDFKYVIQDTNCVYFGRELTYNEMMDRDDIPFKFKAIISAHIAREADLDARMTDHIMGMAQDSFSYRIFNQLKMTVRVCSKEQKKGFSGKVKEKWLHKAYPVRQFGSICREQVTEGSMMIEEISISKLALMTISI